MSQITIAWFLSQSTMATVLGDWFFIKHYYSTGTCTLYDGDAHNLFGTLCGVDLTDINSTVASIQGMILANMALSIMLFFAVYFKPDLKIFKMVVALIMFILSSTSSILWHTIDKDTLPDTVDIVNYYGVGWYFNTGVILFSFISMCLTFTNTK